MCFRIEKKAHIIFLFILLMLEISEINDLDTIFCSQKDVICLFKYGFCSEIMPESLTKRSLCLLSVR